MRLPNKYTSLNVRRSFTDATVLYLPPLVHRDDIIADHQIRSAPVTPPIPRSMATSTNDTTNQRERVLKELINTEQEYHKELTAFCDKVLPAFKQVGAATALFIYVFIYLFIYLVD